MTLRRTEFHCLRFRFHTVVEEVCILVVIITIAAGCAAAVADDLVSANNILVVWVPIVFLWFVVAVSVVLVLVQLCVACRRVEGGQVVNRLRRPAVVTVTFFLFVVCYFLGGFIVLGIIFSGKGGHTWFLSWGITYLVFL